MASQSKYYQVTNTLLLEYKTDQYKITSINSNIGQDYTQFIAYQGIDGNQYYLDKSNINGAKFTDGLNSTYYYGGKDIKTFENIDFVNNQNADDIFGQHIYVNNQNIGTIIKDKDGNEMRSAQVNYDKLRIYLLTGYVMNAISGISLRIKAKVTKVNVKDENDKTIIKRVNDYITLFEWYMPKELLKDNIKWLANPLYLNSCFYDRYIELDVLSALDAALNEHDIDYVYEYENPDGSIVYMRGKIDQYADVFIEFQTSQAEHTTMFKDSASLYESNVIFDAKRTFSIKSNSNSNYFNARIYEDPESKSIMYYPVYGDLTNAHDFDIPTMAAIDSGTIPMIDVADLDHANDGIDDFIEMYGDDVYKWIIINELAVTYIYDQNIKVDTSKSTELIQTEYYTNTIDYTNKKFEHGEFWRSKFIPNIKEKNNMHCKSITIQYTAHLFNRMNNIDIIRTASMMIDDPYKYTLTSINTNNIMQYKIVNKIEDNKIIINNQQTENKPAQIIKSYVDTTNIVIKDDESSQMYSQGKMTLYLKHSGSNYAIRLFTTDDKNVNVPMNLSGQYDYKLVFPSVTGHMIEIFPNKSSDRYNLGIGQLIFFIPKDTATAIMNVPVSERYFAITTHLPNNKADETALYEGHVEFYV